MSQRIFDQRGVVVADYSEQHEYAFDVKLFAAVRVKAADEQAARAWLREHLNGADANLGQGEDGKPIITEVSLDDGEESLYEVDGEPV